MAERRSPVLRSPVSCATHSRSSSFTQSPIPTTNSVFAMAPTPAVSACSSFPSSNVPPRAHHQLAPQSASATPSTPLSSVSASPDSSHALRTLLPPFILAVDVCYKWVFMCAHNATFGFVLMLALHVCILLCYTNRSPKSWGGLALSVLVAPLIPLWQAVVHVLAVRSGAKKNIKVATKKVGFSSFPMYKGRGIFAVFVVGQVVFWYCNLIHPWQSSTQTTSTLFAQFDALLSLLDCCSHTYNLLHAFDSHALVVMWACMMHDMVLGVLLNHSRAFMPPTSWSVWLLHLGIHTRVLSVLGVAVCMAKQEAAKTWMFVVVIFLSCMVWPLCHTLGLFALLLCTANFAAAARANHDLLCAYKFVLRWLQKTGASDTQEYNHKISYLRGQWGTEPNTVSGPTPPMSPSGSVSDLVSATQSLISPPTSPLTNVMSPNLSPSALSWDSAPTPSAQPFLSRARLGPPLMKLATQLFHNVAQIALHPRASAAKTYRCLLRWGCAFVSYCYQKFGSSHIVVLLRMLLPERYSLIVGVCMALWMIGVLIAWSAVVCVVYNNAPHLLLLHWVCFWSIIFLALIAFFGTSFGRLWVYTELSLAAPLLAKSHNKGGVHIKSVGDFGAALPDEVSSIASAMGSLSSFSSSEELGRQSRLARLRRAKYLACGHTVCAGVVTQPGYAVIQGFYQLSVDRVLRFVTNHGSSMRINLDILMVIAQFLTEADVPIPCVLERLRVHRYWKKQCCSSPKSPSTMSGLLKMW